MITLGQYKKIDSAWGGHTLRVWLDDGGFEVWAFEKTKDNEDPEVFEFLECSRIDETCFESDGSYIGEVTSDYRRRMAFRAKGYDNRTCVLPTSFLLKERVF